MIHVDPVRKRYTFIELKDMRPMLKNAKEIPQIPFEYT
jgi:hypothetical protein